MYAKVRTVHRARNNPTVYPAEDNLKNVEFQADIGAILPVYDQYWQRLKAGR